MSVENHILGIGEKLTKQGQSTQPNTQQESTPPMLRRGIIASYHADSGTYAVSVVGNDGTEIDLIPNLLPWDNKVSFGITDHVWLIYAGPIPFILSASAGGSSTNSSGVTGYIRFFS